MLLTIGPRNGNRSFIFSTRNGNRSSIFSRRSAPPSVPLRRSTIVAHASAAVMFCRFVTSAEVQRRADFFEPFILGLSNLDIKTVSLPISKSSSMPDSLTPAVLPACPFSLRYVLGGCRSEQELPTRARAAPSQICSPAGDWPVAQSKDLVEFAATVMWLRMQVAGADRLLVRPL